jgi:hypothetical protein
MEFQNLAGLDVNPVFGRPFFSINQGWDVEGLFLSMKQPEWLEDKKYGFCQYFDLIRIKANGFRSFCTAEESKARWFKPHRAHFPSGGLF